MKLRPEYGVYYSNFRLLDGTRIRRSLGTADKGEAARREASLRAQLESVSRAPSYSGGYQPPMALGITLKKAFPRAMKEHERWRASNSKKTIEDNYKHVSSYFGEDTDLATITRARALKFVEDMEARKLSSSTINQRLSLLSVLMTLAEGWTNGTVTPIKMPRRTIKKGRIRILSRAEEGKVIKWFQGSERMRSRDKDMADLVVFLVDTGFRLSEALNLLSAEVQWDTHMVPAWETKGGSPRMVPMTKRVEEVLKRRATMARPFGMFSKDSADDHWEAMRRGIKVNVQDDPEFVIHALRHTCASRLASSGMDAFRIQKWMGHKSIATTQLYVTLFGCDLKDLARALDRGHQNTNPEVPKVPKTVPKVSEKAHKGRIVGYTAGPVTQLQLGFDLGPEPEQPVGVGLLIRRSLVRAQVEEPEIPKRATFVT